MHGPGTSRASSFAELGVGSDLVSVLERAGIHAPFDIQRATIPDAMAGRDVLGRAPTGSGKTLAFGLPMISKLRVADPGRPTGLILSPTRELAEQIRRELEPLATKRDQRTLAVYGGVGFGPQLRALHAGVELLVACPGRLQDLIDQGEVSLDSVRIVVVDEADRMADMGFLPDVQALLDLTSARRQTLLFSATLGREVKVLTDRYQSDPVFHQVGEAEPDLSLVTHRFIRTDRHRKVPLAAYIIEEAGQTIVFCRTRYGVDRIARQLKAEGVKTSLIHGKRTQNQRDNALGAFTRGKVAALVATDVAARGIHVDDVACVLHFDPPEDHDAYVHRSGRTARAGARGLVVSFVNSDQVNAAKRIQRAFGLALVIEDAPRLDDREPATDHVSGSSRPKQRTSSTRNSSSNRTDGPRPKPSTGSKSRATRRSGKPRSKPRSQSGSKARSKASGAGRPSQPKGGAKTRGGPAKRPGTSNSRSGPNRQRRR